MTPRSPAQTATLLAPLALLIHGFHPWAEDGGLYVAGIKRLLHSELYAASAPFVEAHLRFSLFATAVAALVRLSHLSLPTILLLLQLASLWTTLYAIGLLAARTFAHPNASLGAMLLLATTLSVPVAGTSLILVDPYVTARSIAFPCTLLALATAINPNPALCALAILAAAAIHPLMGGFALGTVLLIVCFRRPNLRTWAPATLCALAIGAAAALYLTAPPEPADYLPVALSRYYWFLSRWHWYELLGLAAPLVILAAFTRRAAPPLRQLLEATLVAAGTAVLIALIFARINAPTHLVARLQPLRIFQIVYAVMILVLGASLAGSLRRPFHWLATFTLLGAIFFATQRATYPASDHVEWPGHPPTNRYQQAFLWISRNTPVDAVFALDAHYISAPGEDAQSFRALAERSALPDYSKDGGEASISPFLTPAWTAAQTPQQALSSQTDAQRLANLRPFHVTWIVLAEPAATSFLCPYRNSTVKVCRLP